MKRDEILQQAGELLNHDRQADYGDAYDTHRTIADMWTALLIHEDVDVKMDARLASLFMVCVKLARAVKTPHKADTYLDMVAYAALAGEFATENDR